MTSICLEQPPGQLDPDLLADWKEAGGVCLDGERLESALILGQRAAPFAGQPVDVHVPSVKYRGVWRTGVVSFDAPMLPYSLNVLSRHDDSVSVTLGALGGYALGRPVSGYTPQSGPTSFFGDPKSRTRGLSGLDVHVHPDGTAALVGDMGRGQRRVLEGVQPHELGSLVQICLSVFVYKHKKALAERVASKSKIGA